MIMILYPLINKVHKESIGKIGNWKIEIEQKTRKQEKKH